MSKILVEVELPNILAGCEIKVTAVSNGENCVPIDLDSRVMVEESENATDAKKPCLCPIAEVQCTCGFCDLGKRCSRR